MTQRQMIEQQVLDSLQSGPVLASDLVQLVSTGGGSRKYDVREVRETLRSLVDTSRVRLTWHGELELDPR